ncbi:MAG: DUF2062 domain-containing protein, partial [Acidobacteriota bacterium]
LDLVLAERRGDFEVEVLVKGLWTGTKVVEVPVCNKGGDRLRFGGLDSPRLFWLVFLLWLKRLLLPEPVLVHLSLKSHRKDGKKSVGSLLKDVLRHECPTARHFSLSVALGVFCGLAPIWGGQMYAAILAAHRLRLSKTISVLATNVSFPAAIPFIIYASVQLGRLICGGSADALSLPDSGQAALSISHFAIEYVIGALVLASSAGAVMGAVAYLAARRVSWFRRESLGASLKTEAGTEP